MVDRCQARKSSVLRAILLATIIAPGFACVGAGNGLGLTAWKRTADEQIKLPEAEQLIDDLDRILTAYGTISVKTPDVWGQDRLAKFRCEYEAQMASWLKVAFKSDINASVRRNESEATRFQIGTEILPPLAKGANPAAQQASAVSLDTVAKAHAGVDASLPPAASLPDKSQASLESTVVLDEHSNYLNHLNQLRRVNAGDDLADRPGYGLYLVRIPVTLSPGPRSRRGKGAIITVSAKSVMTKHTLRNALRNAVVNETVNNLSQAICNQWTEEGARSSGPGSGHFSLVAFADTTLFYGRKNIALLSDEAKEQLAGDLSDEPHHRAARVSEWVRNELEASYHLLEEAAAPIKSGQPAAQLDPLEELADHVARRDFAEINRIAQTASYPLDDPMVKTASGKARSASDELAGRRMQVLNILAFALKIQAAGVNRRLKHDIADQVPDVDPKALRTLSLFEPEPSDQAFQAFEKYVNAKWPLRVYAIEPVIAQQNVADVFGRRTQTALDLVGSGLLAPAKVIAGFGTERRAQDDETAIRLNPTMVGFGAGQSTFGWIFYPRLQTSSGRSGRLLTDVALLLNGHLPDPVGGDQSIEPGQRECTVLIEMPNFIPKIEFVTVADWFRTSEVGDGQKADLERSSILGRKLVAAENAINQAKVDGQYRPEEYQIAMDRIKQLRDLMPTQRLFIRVPFSGDHNDSRIFCSQGLQLRPSLLGWHGKPPVRGEESTIFLEGRNFSVHDTHVIAGGKLASAVLVSRNLLEVTIAKDASPTPTDRGSDLLDVNVGTPNGVSNHLLIPMCPNDARFRPGTVEKIEKVEKVEKVEKILEHPEFGPPKALFGLKETRPET